MGKLSTADMCGPKTLEVADEPFYDLSPNDMAAVVWDESGSLMWYIGIYLDTNMDGTHQVDHLTR